MDSSETAFAGSTNAVNPEYHARHVGRAKYAIVLSGSVMRSWVEDMTRKRNQVAQALNLAEGL
jgi:hypothetical protein